MALTVSNLKRSSVGNKWMMTGRIAFDTSYPTGGETLTAAQVGLARFTTIELQPEQGYFFETMYGSIEPSSVLLKVWQGGLAGFTPAGTNSTSAVTGTAAAQTWTPGAYTPSGTISAPTFTGNLAGIIASSSSPIFTGSTPATQTTYSITYVAVPDGNPIYVKFSDDGQPYLCCNMATDTTDKVITFVSGIKLMIKHDAGAASGLQVYFDDDAGDPEARLMVNNTVYALTTYLKCNDGSVVNLVHNANAAVDGVAINYDDGADERIEAALPGLANANMATSSVRVFLVGTPNGSVSTPTITVNSYTPTGTISVPTFTGDPATLTGTNSTSAVTGTAAAQTFTGAAVAASVAAQVSNGTNLSALSAVEFVAYGY